MKVVKSSTFRVLPRNPVRTFLRTPMDHIYADVTLPHFHLRLIQVDVDYPCPLFRLCYMAMLHQL
jgi:hypothetical protein